MNKNKLFKRWLAAVLCLAATLTASGYDFMVDGIAYNILPDGNSVEVTYQNDLAWHYGTYVYLSFEEELDCNLRPSYDDLSNILIIPDAVDYDGHSYRVVSIGILAFYKCKNLKSVTIGKFVEKIGAAAFSECYSIDDYFCRNRKPAYVDDCITIEWEENPDIGSVETENLYTFGDEYSYGTLHVPSGCLEAYRDNWEWSYTFNDNIVDDVDVEDVYGDVNYDDKVDIDDVNAVLNLMLGWTSLYSNQGDVNGDGNVDVDDMNIIINIILGIETEPEKEYTVNGVRFKMINVKGSTFTMGATAEQSGASANEKPTHQVTLSSYSIGETPVTQALWQAVMGNNPSYDTSDPRLPVEQVSWNDCQTFINKLNQLTGETFRLPTEAEWEYAARGGNKSEGYKWAGSNTSDDVAWHKGNSDAHTHVVATKSPNELGIYDMSGNVWEPCQDWWSIYTADAVSDPTGPAEGTKKVIRGGCFNDSDAWARVSYRQNWGPDQSSRYCGLRLAM